ncbi:NLR family member X1 [Acipenser ruthenus]|uniref:NLR family member X1 n=1 Tax=Acipenser ruthenus TaxID=7906 RepID=UPI002740C85E|nr:NLR family member X1 [Acipenser ruthenus]XP_058866130.1 NLR family member X1 [Acipenser ruthenus]XP_058866131.1 NLR family member X1 [Acipenser ruthenus]XP_058866132.1 NLR family member X1 [Acipenser ruthenus]XP_058866133.1 NLR family member X1 [Acipenser ruthenus]
MLQCWRHVPRTGTQWISRAGGHRGFLDTARTSHMMKGMERLFGSSRVYRAQPVKHEARTGSSWLRYSGRLWEKCFPVCASQNRHLASSSPSDPVEIHKRKLALWFSHLPNEEKQFGGLFSPDTMHVEPLILEGPPGENVNPLTGRETPGSVHRSLTVGELFDPDPGWDPEQGQNVVLYGAVGTGKSTVVRKLVLDWCSGTTLAQFELVVPLSCEDLSLQSRPTSLQALVGRMYRHLRHSDHLRGDGRDVLFIFNGMEKMRLNFSIAATELCSNPEEPLHPGAIAVNLLRKYLLPEASILVTTRPSALDKIPSKYVDRYTEICGFTNIEQQRAYFTSRLLQQAEGQSGRDSQELLEMLYLNLQRESQIAAACFLPSYCWLTCATLHFLHFTDVRAPIRTLTGIYTSFLRLNFGGEILEAAGGPNQQGISLMHYVAKTVGKLAYEGITCKRTSFTKEEVMEKIGEEDDSDEELRQLAVFRTDVLGFFLARCVQSSPAGGMGEIRYVFTVPAMQEYLAALYVVLGEKKTVLEKLGKGASEVIGQASDDLTTLLNVLSKFLPLRVFAFFNLLKMFPRLYSRISGHSNGKIGKTMASEMFKTEDQFNEDVLDQVEQSVLGVQGPAPLERQEQESFELFPIFMGGLLSHGNRVLLDQLGISIRTTAVVQITRTLKRHLLRNSQKQMPPEELVDFLFFLYEFQNQRFTAEVLGSLSALNLSRVRMTPLKCFVLAAVLACTPPRHVLESLDLSSCSLTCESLDTLRPVLLRCKTVNLQCNNLGPEACDHLRSLLIDSACAVQSLHLCDNPLSESSARSLAEALLESRSLRHLSLMNTDLGDGGARELASGLGGNQGLEEINMAYNSIGDNAALQLLDACRANPTLNTIHLYLNELSESGKHSLHSRGLGQGESGRVKVLASITQGDELSEDWELILNNIRSHATSWNRQRVRENLQRFLQELKGARQQNRSVGKKLSFWRVQRQVAEEIRNLEKGTSS